MLLSKKTEKRSTRKCRQNVLRFLLSIVCSISRRLHCSTFSLCLCFNGRHRCRVRWCHNAWSLLHWLFNLEGLFLFSFYLQHLLPVCNSALAQSWNYQRQYTDDLISAQHLFCLKLTYTHILALMFNLSFNPSNPSISAKKNDILSLYEHEFGIHIALGRRDWLFDNFILLFAFVMLISPHIYN